MIADINNCLLNHLPKQLKHYRLETLNEIWFKSEEANCLREIIVIPISKPGERSVFVNLYWPQHLYRVLQNHMKNQLEYCINSNKI